MLEVENGMIIPKPKPNKKAWDKCVYCGEYILEGEEITCLFNYVTHRECFDDFIKERREDTIAELEGFV